MRVWKADVNKVSYMSKSQFFSRPSAVDFDSVVVLEVSSLATPAAEMLAG